MSLSKKKSEKKQFLNEIVKLKKNFLTKRNIYATDSESELIFIILSLKSY